MIKYKKIANLDKMKIGDHIVLLYKDMIEILSASVSFIKTSLARNEKCLYIKGDLDENLLLAELKKQIPDLDSNIARGQLQFLTKDETYALSNNFKADRMITKLKKESIKALKEGYAGLSITGELSWVLNFENGKEEIIEYEWKLNQYIFDDYPLIAMCRYNLNKFDKSIIKAIIELHHYVIWQGKIHENPYYIIPEGYRDNKIVEYEIESWLKNIQKYKKRESIFKEKLKKSKNKYKKLFHAAPIGIVTTTLDGKVLKINKSMAEILGFNNLQLALEYYFDLAKDLYLDPERREEFLKVLKKDGSVKGFEFEVLKKDGSYIWLSMNAQLDYQTDDNSIIRAFVFDISARKNREKEIKEQKEELAASYEQISAYNEEVTAMNEELERSFLEIETLNNRFRTMIALISNIDNLSTISEVEFLSKILKQAVEIIPEADFGSAYTFGENHVEFIDCVGYDLESLKVLKIPNEFFYNQGSTIEIVDSEEIRERDRKYLDKDQFKNLNNFGLDKYQEIMYFDLVINSEQKAGISLDIKEGSKKNFTNSSKKLFSAFHNLATSFYKMKEYNFLQNNFTKELIASTIKMLEMHDLYTRGHSENVAELAVEIAEELQLKQKQIDDLYWAGLVHDIGKLLIPLEILNKKGNLSEQEYELVKQHPVSGSRALKSSNSLKHIAKCVRHHHERWDGRGYPDGLKENDIPLESQILCVADAWDAMTSKRIYRQPLSYKQALLEIENNSGSQFAPAVAEALLELLLKTNNK